MLLEIYSIQPKKKIGRSIAEKRKNFSIATATTTDYFHFFKQKESIRMFVELIFGGKKMYPSLDVCVCGLYMDNDDILYIHGFAIYFFSKSG